MKKRSNLSTETWASPKIRKLGEELTKETEMEKQMI